MGQGETTDEAANPLDDPSATGSQLYEQMRALPTDRTASERIASTKSIHDSFKQRRRERNEQQKAKAAAAGGKDGKPRRTSSGGSSKGSR